MILLVMQRNFKIRGGNKGNGGNKNFDFMLQTSILPTLILLQQTKCNVKTLDKSIPFLTLGKCKAFTYRTKSVSRPSFGLVCLSLARLSLIRPST